MTINPNRMNSYLEDDGSEDDRDIVFQSLQGLLLRNENNQEDRLDNARRIRETQRNSLYEELEPSKESNNEDKTSDSEVSSPSNQVEENAERYIAGRVLRSSECDIGTYFARPIIFAPQRIWRRRSRHRSIGKTCVEKVSISSLHVKTPDEELHETHSTSPTNSSLRRLPQPLGEWYVRLHSLTPPKVVANS